MKFEQIFDSMEEAENILKNLDTNLIKQRLNGVDYLLSFKTVLSKGEDLSSKQKTQLKRLAKQIAKGYILQKNNQ